MDLTFYDVAGRPVAYCDDSRHIYAFSGAPLAYLDGDSVFTFDGHHLGWWSAGYVRDHDGALALFTDGALPADLPLPSKKLRPAKARKLPVPMPAFKPGRPERARERRAWSARSGAQFFH